MLRQVLFFVLLIYFYVFQMGTQVWYKFEDIVRRMNVREEEEEKKEAKERGIKPGGLKSKMNEALS